MSTTVVCPGSFDPVTNGHLDVFERACAQFDEVVVAVLENPHKESTFTIDERVDFIEAQTPHLANLEVATFSGLLVDFCRSRGVSLVCKGLRAVQDFEYEVQMAQMNRHIAGVETVFVSTNPEHGFVSSSLVKEVIRGGRTVEGLVPPRVAEALRKRLR